MTNEAETSPGKLYYLHLHSQWVGIYVMPENLIYKRYQTPLMLPCLFEGNQPEFAGPSWQGQEEGHQGGDQVQRIRPKGGRQRKGINPAMGREIQRDDRKLLGHVWIWRTIGKFLVLTRDKTSPNSSWNRQQGPRGGRRGKTPLHLACI